MKKHHLTNNFFAKRYIFFKHYREVVHRDGTTSKENASLIVHR
jgi:hypothetical protein